MVQRGIEWRHLNQVTWPLLRGFTKGWFPPSCSLGVLTNTRKTTKNAVKMFITYKRADLLCLIRATREENKRQNARMLTEKSDVSKSVFLSLFKLKRSANVTSV